MISICYGPDDEREIILILADENLEIEEEDSDEDILSEFFNSSDNEDDTLETAYIQVSSARYLNCGSAVSQASERINWLLHQLDDYQFKQEVRMTRDLW